MLILLYSCICSSLSWNLHYYIDDLDVDYELRIVSIEHVFNILTESQKKIESVKK